MIAGLILAAGAGRRFGAPKQLAPLGGEPVLEHVVTAFAAAPLDDVVVVLGANAEAILERVDLHGARSVRCVDWERGQAHSLRAGVRALANAEAVVVALGDQPLLSPLAIERVLAGRGPEALAVRATYAGRPGHPIVLEPGMLKRIETLTGDVGARGLLDAVAVSEVACDGLGSPFDVDTPEQLDRLNRGS